MYQINHFVHMICIYIVVLTFSFSSEKVASLLSQQRGFVRTKKTSTGL